MNDSMQSNREAQAEEEKAKQSVMEKALIYFFTPTSMTIEGLHIEIVHIIALCMSLIVFFLMLLLRTMLYVRVEAIFVPVLCFHTVSMLIDFKKIAYAFNQQRQYRRESEGNT